MQYTTKDQITNASVPVQVGSSFSFKWKGAPKYLTPSEVKELCDTDTRKFTVERDTNKTDFTVTRDS